MYMGNHSTAVISENRLLGFVLLFCEGKGTLLVPGLSVVEEMGLSPCLLPSPLLRETSALKEGKEKQQQYSVLLSEPVAPDIFTSSHEVYQC